MSEGVLATGMSEQGCSEIGLLTGSSASVSVSPAPNCPGVVLILFGLFTSLAPNNLVLKLPFATLAASAPLAELPAYLEVNMTTPSSSSSSSPLSGIAICACFCIEGEARGGLCSRGDEADFLGVGILAGVKKAREPKLNSVAEECLSFRLGGCCSRSEFEEDFLVLIAVCVGALSLDRQCK